MWNILDFRVIFHYEQEKVVVMALLNVQNLSIRFRSGGRMLPVVDRISFEGAFYRHDIGQRALNAEVKQ